MTVALNYRSSLCYVGLNLFLGQVQLNQAFGVAASPTSADKFNRLMEMVELGRVRRLSLPIATS